MKWSTTLVLVALVLLVAFQTVDAAKKPRKEKKGQTEETAAAAGGPKKALSDRELDKLVHELDREDYDDMMSARKPTGKFKEEPIDFKKIDPLKLLGRSKSGKPLMVIVTLFNKLSRDDAENLGVSWNNGLRQAFLKASVYVIDEEKILFQFEDGADVIRARGYLLSQPEVDYIEYDSQKHYPPGREEPKDEENDSEEKANKLKDLIQDEEALKNLLNNKDEL